jgi:hypothetical protein
VSSEEERRCYIGKGYFGRWIIVNAADDRLAWDGQCWAPHDLGLPTGKTQICNFETVDEAATYASDNGLTVSKQILM